MPQSKNNNPKPSIGKAELVLGTKPTDMVTNCRQQVATMKQCADWPNQPTIQAAALAVEADADAVDTTLKGLAALRAQTRALEVTREQEVVTLVRDHEHLCTTVTVVCKGSPAAVKAWGGKVASRAPSSPSTDAPLNVVVKNTTTSGTIEVACKADRRAAIYLVQQQGADPANPQSWPAPVLCPRRTFRVSGLVAGTKAAYRVAMVRRNGGQSLWSDVMTVIVR